MNMMQEFAKEESKRNGASFRDFSSEMEDLTVISTIDTDFRMQFQHWNVTNLNFHALRCHRWHLVCDQLDLSKS
jgi:hypothetical protein